MLMNGVSVHCTYTETGLPGSESESRDKSFSSRCFNKKKKEGKRDGSPHLQTFREKSCILHCRQWIKNAPSWPPSNATGQGCWGIIQA